MRGNGWVVLERTHGPEGDPSQRESPWLPRIWDSPAAPMEAKPNEVIWKQEEKHMV